MLAIQPYIAKYHCSCTQGASIFQTQGFFDLHGSVSSPYRSFPVKIGSEYGGHLTSFASTTFYPGKYFESLAQAINMTQASSNQQEKFFRIPGPAGSGMCVLSGGSVTGGSTECFKAGECTNGATLVFWIQVPQVADLKTAGNLTLLKKGHVRVLYGNKN